MNHEEMDENVNALRAALEQTHQENANQLAKLVELADAAGV